MKKILFIAFLFFTPFLAKAQVGVSYHYFPNPGLSFLGINYEIKERFLPELRLNTNGWVEELGVELVVNYIFLKRETAHFYGGIGGRFNLIDAVVVPLGANFYPFENKNFGFQFEIAPLIDGESAYLRGTLGLRYRFKKS